MFYMYAAANTSHPFNIDTAGPVLGDRPGIQNVKCDAPTYSKVLL